MLKDKFYIGSRRKRTLRRLRRLTRWCRNQATFRSAHAIFRRIFNRNAKRMLDRYTRNSVALVDDLQCIATTVLAALIGALASTRFVAGSALPLHRCGRDRDLRRRFIGVVHRAATRDSVAAGAKNIFIDRKVGDSPETEPKTIWNSINCPTRTTSQTAAVSVPRPSSDQTHRAHRPVVRFSSSRFAQDENSSLLTSARDGRVQRTSIIMALSRPAVCTSARLRA